MAESLVDEIHKLRSPAGLHCRIGVKVRDGSIDEAPFDSLGERSPRLPRSRCSGSRALEQRPWPPYWAPSWRLRWHNHSPGTLEPCRFARCDQASRSLQCREPEAPCLLLGFCGAVLRSSSLQMCNGRLAYLIQTVNPTRDLRLG